MSDGWQQEAERLLRTIDPVGMRGVPVYLIDAPDDSELWGRTGLPFPLAETAFACTAGAWFSYDMRAAIDANCPGGWRGPGFTAMFRVDAITRWCDSIRRDPAEQLIGTTLHEFAHYAAASHGHDLLFSRMLLHVAYRAEKHGWRGDYRTAFANAWWSHVSPPRRYAHLIEPEMIHRFSDPLHEIARTPPPAEMQRLWFAETGEVLTYG